MKTWISLWLALLAIADVPGGRRWAAEASLMGKTIGLLGNSEHHRLRQPWDVRRYGVGGHRRHHTVMNHFEDPQLFLANSEQSSMLPHRHMDGSEHQAEPVKEPCVGLCFHRKLMNMDPDDDGLDDSSFQLDSDEDTFQMQGDLPEETMEAAGDEEGTVSDAPCVGVCQFYREQALAAETVPVP